MINAAIKDMRGRDGASVLFGPSLQIDFVSGDNRCVNTAGSSE